GPRLGPRDKAEGGKGATLVWRRDSIAIVLYCCRQRSRLICVDPRPAGETERAFGRQAFLFLHNTHRRGRHQRALIQASCTPERWRAHGARTLANRYSRAGHSREGN
ncbi:unnamed protein product, partial [Ectocarpus sp. 12 AP-2014]